MMREKGEKKRDCFIYINTCYTLYIYIVLIDSIDSFGQHKLIKHSGVDPSDTSFCREVPMVSCDKNVYSSILSHLTFTL